MLAAAAGPAETGSGDGGKGVMKDVMSLPFLLGLLFLFPFGPIHFRFCEGHLAKAGLRNQEIQPRSEGADK
jgi:hypothetical protein